MMRLFLHIQQRGLRLSPELKQLVRRRLKYVDTEFQYAKVNREVFAEILRRKGQVSAILREMHDVDFLGRWMPEFGELTCLVQHEFFHRFTVDEHTLFCVEKLDELVDTEEEALVGLKNLFHQVEDPYVLYLALILHDTGKSANRRAHSDISAINADKVARRLQLNAEQRRSLIFLVDNHEMLAKTAQRRNLDDPQTIDEFAKLVKNRKNLDELMLLTCADGRGVGDPAMWTGWKQSLFWQLYRHTSQYLEDSAAYHEARKIERDSIRAAVRELLPLEFALEVEAHFRSLPDRYFQTREPREIADHILLFRKFLEVRWADSALALAPAVQWVEHPAAGYSEVWVCTWDRRQLLARIAGSLSVCGLNILSADIFTRDDGLVLDIFRVCTTRLAHVADERDKLRVEKYLREALAGEEYDFQPLIEKAFAKTGFHLSQVHDFPRRITISDSHPLYNMVDILTADRLGLLYGILRAITDAGFQIATARVTTEKGAAIDNFYLTDDEGRKVTSKSRIDRLRRALAAATLDPRFEGRDAGPAPR
jgi:[protein-PII] uridylyltransferase